MSAALGEGALQGVGPLPASEVGDAGAGQRAAAAAESRQNVLRRLATSGTFKRVAPLA